MHYQTTDNAKSSAISGWAIAGLVVALVIIALLVMFVLFKKPPPPPKASVKAKGLAPAELEEAPLEFGNTLEESPAQEVVRVYTGAPDKVDAPVTTGADMDDAEVVPKGRPLYSLDPDSDSFSSSSSSSMSEDFSLSL